MAGDNFTIEIKGLDRVISKFRNAPKTISREMRKGMKASLEVIHENVPGYPPQRSDQKTPYIRQGTLAKSIGVTQSGAKAGKPTVYSIRGSGQNMEGKFGTNLSYAKYVIGDPDAPKGEGQAYMHKGWWWTLDFVKRRATAKIIALWNEFIKRAMDA